MINNILFMILFLIVLITNVFAEQPKICFFADEGFQGKSICATQGQAVSDLKMEWNDRISSIAIPPGMVVTAFQDINFSGKNFTFKESVDLYLSRRWADLNDAIRSFKIRSAACFYETDDFGGESICLSGNERIDLYHSSDLSLGQHHILNPLNDRVNSIKIPPNTQVTVYQDNNYSGKYFVLTDDFAYEELEKIGMNDSITSIKVSQKEHFICDQYCIIKGNQSIPLGEAFGSYWLDDRIKYKESLISFDLNGEDNFSIEFFDGGIFKVIGRAVIYIHNTFPNNSFIFALRKGSDRLSFLSRFNGGYSEVQFIESKDNKAVYISPLVGSLFDFGLININVTINNFNEDQALVVNKVILTAEKAEARSERSILGTAACWLIPIINIYNYVIQDNCNQVDRVAKSVYDFFNNPDNKILQISGSAKPLPKMNNSPIEFEVPFATFNSGVGGWLTHITINMQGGSLTVPATARACNVSVKDQILPHLMRQRRDIIPYCVEWTLNILTDFTLLFGDSIDTWNADNFGRVIERILREGNIGHAASNSESERRLIENVRANLAENTDNMIHIKTAFNFSQLSYADYMQNQTSQQVASPPVIIQQYPLGRYELALQNFQLVETVPRIRREGQWVNDPDLQFEVELISGITAETQSARLNVLPVIEEWRQTYYQAKKQLLMSATSGKVTDMPFDEDDISSEADSVIETATVTETASRLGVVTSIEATTTIEAACLVSDVAQSWLRSSRDDYIYVIVRLAGRVVSITMAIDINEHDSGIAGSLSHPDYVLHPAAEGTIRGAGTAAIKALAIYLKAKGRRSLISDVISEPSAIVKNKVGFKFAEEF
ncbi:TPA: peptidase inhibitor family I36 protein [Yersinia enterocolitica]|nr:peptidase inhibitor family I36 protein [Yersinia enterocolitica]HDL7815954.1 peptidase inhibitor family I36 protein [Yersinia enterocolitica]HDL7821056.1 peptidase inhibitor family I36 protein [Yersinia enterocolitica]HDL7841303.1 peptidase inhibitor family I36 protein [Yersinia enterocolitica]HDL7845073.1 peptidase inhibitor family I36 protein [Yersinia enterocolitica]